MKIKFAIGAIILSLSLVMGSCTKDSVSIPIESSSKQELMTATNTASQTNSLTEVSSQLAPYYHYALVYEAGQHSIYRKLDAISGSYQYMSSIKFNGIEVTGATGIASIQSSYEVFVTTDGSSNFPYRLFRVNIGTGVATSIAQIKYTNGILARLKNLTKIGSSTGSTNKYYAIAGIGITGSQAIYELNTSTGVVTLNSNLSQFLGTADQLCSLSANTNGTSLEVLGNGLHQDLSHYYGLILSYNPNITPATVSKRYLKSPVPLHSMLGTWYYQNWQTTDGVVFGSNSLYRNSNMSTNSGSSTPVAYQIPNISSAHYIVDFTE
jgi:hypothetical protein